MTNNKIDLSIQNEPGAHSLRAALASRVRQRIISGQWAPGTRIPTLRALSQEFDVSYDTAQRVLADMRRHGFLVSRGRQGTFVSEHPPHLYHYGLVFSHEPMKSSEWSRFHSALVKAGQHIEQATPLRFRHYFGVRSRPRPDETVDLIEDMRCRRVRGLIYVNTEWIVEPLLSSELQQFPCVAIAESKTWQSRNIPRVWPDYDQFLNRGMAELAQRGRQSVGVLALGDVSDERIHAIAAQAQRHGLVFKPQWYHCVSDGKCGAARQIMHLLMCASAKDRPDALIIADDNLIEEAGEGLVRSGVRVGQDVHVIAHANFPEIVHTPLPMTYVGFDASKVLLACVQHINGLQAASPPDEQATSVAPITSQEYVDAVEISTG